MSYDDDYPVRFFLLTGLEAFLYLNLTPYIRSKDVVQLLSVVSALYDLNDFIVSIISIQDDYFTLPTIETTT